MKYLGIDYGEKKIGLAIAESEMKIATPFKVIENTSKLMANISQIIQGEDIDQIIVGLPKGLQGNESQQYQSVIKFIDKLKNKIDLEILTQDEKLTTSFANKLLQGLPKKKADDDVAAMLILQSYLDEK
jgi:putative pre-16S rRNA nuclease